MLFITFEGPEGSGKTTVLAKIKEKLIQDGIQAIITREPGGSIISEQIREVILNKENKLMDPWTEVLLYIAARQQHLVEKIFPLLKTDKIIICDRFSDSTVAYQGYGRKLGINKINKIQDLVFENFEPNLTIFFDVNPKIGLKRIQKRHKNDFDRLDEENLLFHTLVYQGYKQIAKENPQRIKTIDASKNLENVVAEVYQLIKQEITNK